MGSTLKPFVLFILCLLAFPAAAQTCYSAGGGPVSITGGGRIECGTIAPLIVAPVTPPLGTVQTNYSFLIPVSGGIQPYHCALFLGTLPLNTAVSVAAANAGCLISGLLSISAGGIYTGISVSVTDSGSGSATAGPYSINITSPKQCGPPTYPCARTDTAATQLPATPVMGTNGCGSNPLPCYFTGVGTTISDSSFNSATPTVIIRATDANTMCGSRVNFSFYGGVGGSGDINACSSDDTQCLIEDQGNGHEIIQFDPVALTVAGLYTTAYSCSNGHKGLLDVPSGEYSYGPAKLYYGFGNSPSCASTACPTNTSLVAYDNSGPTMPVMTQLFDFQNCLPAGSPIPSWRTVGGPDVFDNYFSEAVSLTGGGQGTGTDAMTWVASTNTCYLYDTVGNFDPVAVSTPITAAQVIAASVTSISITSNVASLTSTNSWTAGQTVALSGFKTSLDFMNGNYTVLASGLSGSQFQVAVTNPNVTSTTVTALSSVAIFTSVNSWTAGQQLYVLGLSKTAAKLNGHIFTLSSFGLTGTQFQSAYASAALSASSQHGTASTFHSGFYKFTCTGSGIPLNGLCPGGTWTQTFLGYANPVLGNFTIHNVKQSKWGLWLIIAHQICLTTCAANLPQQYWLNGTTTVNFANGNFGHWSEGKDILVGLGASSRPYWTWNVIRFAVPPTANPVCPPTGSDICLLQPAPPTCNKSFSNQPCILLIDSHPNWSTNNPTFQTLWGLVPDTTPIITTSYSNAWNFGQLRFGPYVNEVMGINTCNALGGSSSTCNASGNPAWRFGNTFNSTVSAHFSTQFQIGAAFQSGKFYLFGSDWNGTLGVNAGSASGTCAGAVVTAASVTSNLATITASNNFPTTLPAPQVLLNGFTGASAVLNGQYLQLSAGSVTGSGFQALITTPNFSQSGLSGSAENIVGCRGDLFIMPLK